MRMSNVTFHKYYLTYAQVGCYAGYSSDVTLASEDAQVIPLFSREETDDTDDTDDTGWYRLKGDSMSKVREKRSTSKSGFFF